MKITLKNLKELKASQRYIDYFVKNYGEEAQIKDIFINLNEEKREGDFQMWLALNFKLTCEAKGWYKNGNPMYSFHYKNGKEHGVSKRWYENGKLTCSDIYKDGQKNGLCERWYKNGKLMYFYNYEGGKEHGLAQGWSEDGKLKWTEHFKNGKIIK